jgi:hypothetical protein
VSQAADGITGRDRIEVDFRRVMASITEQACDKGLEVDVMAVLSPFFLDNIGDHDGEDGHEPAGLAP